MHIVSKRAIAFFRTANDTAQPDAVRATASDKLAAYCAQHNIDLAYVVAAVERDSLTVSEQRRADRTPKPAPKPAASEAPKREAPKPEQPSKPAAGSPNADAYAERVAIIDALRATVATIYNGPSLAVRTNPKRVAASVYAELLRAPKHRTKLDKISERDESALMLIVKRGERNGSFDPVALNLDSGIFSRLASVAFIEADGPDAYKLTAAGLQHARAVIRNANKKAA